tara:strand:- start:824 stop:1057 length:234 start_codon:yes stop_codon:yes gene_type:complete
LFKAITCQSPIIGKAGHESKELRRAKQHISTPFFNNTSTADNKLIEFLTFICNFSCFYGRFQNYPISWKNAKNFSVY